MLNFGMYEGISREQTTLDFVMYNETRESFLKDMQLELAYDERVRFTTEEYGGFPCVYYSEPSEY